MVDVMTILTGRYDRTYEGIYYERKPLAITDVGIPFDYEIIDGKYKEQRTLENNLGVSKYRRTSIKSNDVGSWKIGGYVLLQDNSFFQIESVREDLDDTSKESARLFREIDGIAYVLQLIEVDNTLNLKI